MGIFDGCLLVSDIDGTLFKKGKIQPNNIEAIEFFKENGGYFTIATGRGPAICKDICKAAHINAPVIMVNGSVVYDFQNDKFIKEDYLTENSVKLVVQAFKLFPDIAAEITLRDEVVSVMPNEKARYYYKTYRSTPDGGYKTREIKVEEIASQKIMKVLYMTNDNTLLESVKDFFSKNNNGEYENVKSNPEFFEVLTEGTTKAKHIYLIADLLNVKRENIFAIGDYYNDLDLIKKASIGACVGESPNDIKKIADYTAKSVYDGAVADFIYYLKSIKER